MKENKYINSLLRKYKKKLKVVIKEMEESKENTSKYNIWASEGVAIKGFMKDLEQLKKIRI